MYVTSDTDLYLYEVQCVYVSEGCIISVLTVYRSLWSMRNYIHIMLCGNLFISQLLFVVGIEQTRYQVRGVNSF